MIRRALGALARRRLAPAAGRYRVVVASPSGYAYSIDWATPEVIGLWLTGLIESGELDFAPTYSEQRLRVERLRPWVPS